jgi:hypothetical protein
VTEYPEPRRRRAAGTNVRLPDEVHRALRQASIKEDRNLKDLLAAIGVEYLRKRHPDLYQEMIRS